jgi:D-alanyl-D-alanine dipeptidase
MWKYLGPNELIRHHLLTLQIAMRDAGFYGLRSEWWHFSVKDWQSYLPLEEAKRATQAFGLKWEGKL